MPPMAMPTSARDEDRGVVDAVAHKGQRALGPLWAQKVLHPVHLVAGQQLGVDLVQPQLGRPRASAHGGGVAGEHDGADTPGLQRGDGRGGGLA